MPEKYKTAYDVEVTAIMNKGQLWLSKEDLIQIINKAEKKHNANYSKLKEELGANIK